MAVQKRLMGLGLAVVTVVAIALLFVTPATGGLPTALQSPTPSGSSSPSPSPSASSSPSPSPTATPSPSDSGFDPAYRRVRLTASDRNVRVGRRVVFSGSVEANRPECEAQVTVTLRRLIAGTSRRLVVAAEATTIDGRFRFTDNVRWTSVYYATVDRGNGCRRSESDPEAVKARVRFNLRVTDRSPLRGTNTRIYGRVRPSHPHSTVLLQHKVRGAWRTTQRTAISDQSKFSFFPHASWRGARDLRIKWVKSDRDHEAATSRTVTIRTHR